MGGGKNILFKPVVIFLIATAFCVFFSEQGSVVWTLFSRHIKDLFTVSLLIVIMNNTDDIKTKLSGIIMISYFVSIFSLRLGCAINSDFNYKLYRISINDSNVSLLVNSIILMLLLLTITTNGKHE